MTTTANMRVDVGIAGLEGAAAEAELRSLRDWLRADRHTRLAAEPELRSAQAPPAGAQGSVVDVVSLIVGSAFNAASLAVSLVSWRATRRGRSALTVRRADGVVVEITSDSAEQAVQLLEQLGRD
ncbi:hypothetical protein [Streptomyces sp. NPDC088360]|uniref:effector-associated constant component EACC1 n=1 Tax=Streptomyces sp. NPDC088360 TaxID=3154515 RepID=UPI00344F5340